MKHWMLLLLLGGLLLATAGPAYADDTGEDSPEAAVSDEAAEEAADDAGDDAAEESLPPAGGDDVEDPGDAKPEDKGERNRDGDKDKEGEKDKDEVAFEAGPEGITSFTDDWDELTAKLDLSDEQKQRILTIRRTRNQAIEKFDKLTAPKLEKARERLDKLDDDSRKDMKIREQIEAALEQHRQRREKMAEMYERRMFSSLKREQRGTINGPRVAGAMLREFGDLDLSEKQEEKLREVCTEIGQRLPMPYDAGDAFGDGGKNPHDLAIRKVIFQRVLDKDQRKQYAREMKARQPEKPDRDKDEDEKPGRRKRD